VGPPARFFGGGGGGGGGAPGKRGEAFQAPLKKLGWHGGQEEVR
jgi:hypothetical protein